MISYSLVQGNLVEGLELRVVGKRGEYVFFVPEDKFVGEWGLYKNVATPLFDLLFNPAQFPYLLLKKAVLKGRLKKGSRKLEELLMHTGDLFYELYPEHRSKVIPTTYYDMCLNVAKLMKKEVEKLSLKSKGGVSNEIIEKNKYKVNKLEELAKYLKEIQDSPVVRWMYEVNCVNMRLKRSGMVSIISSSLYLIGGGSLDFNLIFSFNPIFSSLYSITSSFGDMLKVPHY